MYKGRAFGDCHIGRKTFNIKMWYHSLSIVAAFNIATNAFSRACRSGAGCCCCRGCSHMSSEELRAAFALFRRAHELFRIRTHWAAIEDSMVEWFNAHGGSRQKAWQSRGTAACGGGVWGSGTHLGVAWPKTKTSKDIKVNIIIALMFQ